MSDSQFANALTMVEAGHDCALATVIETWGSSPRPIGAQLAIRGDGFFTGSVSGGCVEGAVLSEAREVIKTQTPKIVEYGVDKDNLFAAGIACGGTVRILIEPIDRGGHALSQDILATLAAMENRQASGTYQINLQSWAREIHDDTQFPSKMDGAHFRLVIRPAPRLIVIGAVHIAQYLIPMGQMAGFDVVLVDSRGFFTNAERFANVHIMDEWPSDALKTLNIDSETAIVTLTHDDKFDIPALEYALSSAAFYIGALGSRKTQSERNEKLTKLGCDPSRISGPVGLDIGAKTPAEIAISILAEIIEIRRMRDG